MKRNQNGWQQEADREDQQRKQELEAEYWKMFGYPYTSEKRCAKNLSRMSQVELSEFLKKV